MVVVKLYGQNLFWISYI